MADVIRYEEQTLTDEQKEQARENIDAPNKDGYYEQMGVGYAKSLLGNGAATNEIIDFRPSGGTKDIGTGVETIKAIKGNSVVWNQRAKSISSDNYLGVQVSNLTFANGICSFTPNVAGTDAHIYTPLPDSVMGHKYFVRVLAKAASNGALRLRLSGGNVDVTFNISTEWSKYAAVATAIGSGYGRDFSWIIGVGEGISTSIKELVYIDLTQMFGAGNEPTTLDDPRIKWLDSFGYIPYNEGTLLNFKGEGLKTTGVNQTKEDFSIEGLWNVTSLFPVIPGITYYGKVFGSDRLDALYCDTYDANRQLIKETEVIANTDGGTKVFNNDVAFIRLKLRAAPGEEITFDSVQLALYHSGGDIPTTYHPYEEHTLALPITSLKSNGVTIFPDGMKSAVRPYAQGESFDTLAGNSLGVITKAIKRIGVVDLGTLDWNYNGIFFTMLDTARGYGLIASLMAKYTFEGGIASDKTYELALAYQAEGKISIKIKDSAYTDAASFKAAMSGVLLYYELAEPIEYTLDTPINTTTYVNDWGTEQNLPQGVDTQGLPKTTPLNAEIVYAPNVQDAIRNLPKNYIGKESMDAILEAFKTAGIIASFTLTYDATSGKYNCSITKPTE